MLDKIIFEVLALLQNSNLTVADVYKFEDLKERLKTIIQNEQNNTSKG